MTSERLEMIDAERIEEGSSDIAVLIDRRLTRRSVLGGLGAGAAVTALGVPGAPRAGEGERRGPVFTEIVHGIDADSHVSPGHAQQVLIRWGDAVTDGGAPFEPLRQTAAAQARSFGYNADFIAYMPLPRGSDASDHGLLCVNHEYTIGHLMFPGETKAGYADRATARQVAVEMAAHGMSIVEIAREDGAWRVRSGALNRRITALDTPIRLSGPAAGSPRLATASDPAARTVVGMLNNCAGGTTPWGTVLTCEENVNFYFAGERPGGAESANHARMGVGGGGRYGWHRHHERFDLMREPNEPNRFGWVVEVDPYELGSMPVKRTALGRFKHEGATTVVNPDGRVVVYSGDDGRYEYVYRFVTARAFDPADRAANRDLLDDGTLSVARFAEDGIVTWLPLVWGEGPLTPANGFDSQADVVIEARRAGDLLGATRMDRPEDFETNPVTGRVYLILTNNSRREEGEVDAANPRPANRWGHVIEIVPPGEAGAVDHAATEMTWDIFLLAGDPGDSGVGAVYHPDVSENGWLSCPDNCAFDRAGNLWLATDGAPTSVGLSDGLYACATTGPERALTRLFFRAPTGAEVCGPCFTPDDTTLFVAVQHPGDDEGSTFDAPSTRWPDFAEGMPPRPAVVALTRRDGGPIGG